MQEENQDDQRSKDLDAIAGKAGGAYIPPQRLRKLQAGITDKTTDIYQRMTWEALKKSLNGLINKVNIANIKMIIPELLSENIYRGRGVLCKSIMKAQQASLPFTQVYAALLAVINSKFPAIGELILSRLITQFKRAYKRNDKTVCIACTKFIAHLVNQKVAHELLALQLLTLLLERPTDDSIEVGVSFLRDTGAYLTDISSKATNSIFERFRAILNEGNIDKRTQYMVEVLFQVRRDKFTENHAVNKDLDLVEDEEQITHYITLDDELKTEELLNVYKFDVEYIENEEKYGKIKKEILGSDSGGSSTDGDESSDDDELSESENQVVNDARLKILDQTNTNTVILRRAIYLTIMSSLNFEECTHKLMKLNIKEEDQMELCNMIIECCSQERTYINFYGLIGERYSKFSTVWADNFSKCFEETYKTIHRFETSRLRNIGKYFAHLLATDSLSWNVFALINLNEQDTTSSSRIFIKIVFQELVEALGLAGLKVRLNDPAMIITVDIGHEKFTRGAFDGLFPKDNPRNTRFAINYFTSIGLGALTEELREFLKAPHVDGVSAAAGGDNSDSSSDSSDSSSSSSSSSSDSASESEDDNIRTSKRTIVRKSGSPPKERRNDLANRDARDREPESRRRRRQSNSSVSSDSSNDRQRFRSPSDSRRGSRRRLREHSDDDRRSVRRDDDQNGYRRDRYENERSEARRGDANRRPSSRSDDRRRNDAYPSRRGGDDDRDVRRKL